MPLLAFLVSLAGLLDGRGLRVIVVGCCKFRPLDSLELFCLLDFWFDTMLPGRYSYSGRASKSISGNFYWLKMALAIASGLFTYSTLTTERCPHSRRCVSKSVMPKTRLQNEHFPIGFEHSTDSWRIWSYLKIRIPHPSQTTYMKLQSSNSCVPSNNSSYVSWYMQRALLHLNLI